MSSSQLTIQLPMFEGPMALLLYLIRKEEMDIMDIKIHEITNQYLDYIKLMKDFDVEVAGEFVAMASTLIHIKSKMLLPQYDENGEVIEQEDPRKELVQRLLEYQKYQEAAKALTDRAWLGRDVFARGLREKLSKQDDQIELEQNALFSLIGMYRRVLHVAEKRVHKVAAKAQSIASRILEIKDRLIVGAKLSLSDLINTTEAKARQTLITFLSLLELGKMGYVSLSQFDYQSEIWVDVKQTPQSDAISRVEEYDNLNSETVASQLMNSAVEEESFETEISDISKVNPSDDLEQTELLFSEDDIATDEDIELAEQENGLKGLDV